MSLSVVIVGMVSSVTVTVGGAVAQVLTGKIFTLTQTGFTHRHTHTNNWYHPVSIRGISDIWLPAKKWVNWKMKIVGVSILVLYATTCTTVLSSLFLASKALFTLTDTESVNGNGNGSSSSLAPALFVMGDSSVDCGTNNFLGTFARANHLPYGRDFDTHQPTGRFSNGRIPVDYLGIQKILSLSYLYYNYYKSNANN